MYPANTETDFWQRVTKTATCWLWNGSDRGKGYCAVRFNGLQVFAHRLAWELTNGPIQAGLTIDHLCRNRRCVNPRHMEVVSVRENVLRGVGPTAVNARKAFCLKGHEFSSENTRVDKRGRRLYESTLA